MAENLYLDSRPCWTVRPRHGHGHPARVSHTAQRGYTLLELAVVVVILGIAGQVIISSLSSPVEGKVDVAVSEVAAAIRFARNESLRTGDLYGVEIKSNNEQVRVFRADTGTSPPTPLYDVYDPVSKRLWDVDFDDHPFAAGVDLGRSLSYLGTCNNQPFIVFRDGGAPACLDPLSVLLDQGVLTLSLGSATRTVTLDGFTGRVTAQ